MEHAYSDLPWDWFDQLDFVRKYQHPFFDVAVRERLEHVEDGPIDAGSDYAEREGGA